MNVAERSNCTCVYICILLIFLKCKSKIPLIKTVFHASPEHYHTGLKLGSVSGLLNVVRCKPLEKC